MTNMPPPLSSESIDELEDLLRRIKRFEREWVEAHGGEWFEDRSVKEGTSLMYRPWDAPLANKAMKFLYKHKLIIAFDWGGWEEGRQFFGNKDADKFKKLDREFVLKLLTAIARNDRFNDGAWARSFETGDIQKLFARLLEIEKA